MNWHTLLAVDFDKWAAATYRANFPETRVECGKVSDFLDQLPDADVIVGGPPCQPHSHAGKRGASKDARDGGPDFVAAIGKVRPRAFLMENVPGLLTSEGGRYFQRMYAAMEKQGYVVQYRVQDAVSFGVPQFRERLWVWGIRRDLCVDGIRHLWPISTHAWPPPTDCMFGAALLAGVTVGEALGLDGMIGIPRNINERAGNKWYPVEEPSPTIDGIGPSISRIIGGGRNHPADASGNFQRDTRDITGEPSTTIVGTFIDGQLPKVVQYRWSDAMLQKHPPASPASPAPAVQAKYYKGGAEGLLRIEGASGWSGQRILNDGQPAPTIPGGTNQELRQTGLKVRRLSPLECMRLQSAPDDFRWPEKISETAMYKICGNGWASAHGAAFSAALAKADPDSRTVIDLFCGGGLGACGFHGRFWSYQMSDERAVI